jgi:uroporphyrin-III C-methyltransferase/precorrin-2 dehydrogenase/sirohydrochlorin ferrochelatase
MYQTTTLAPTQETSHEGKVYLVGAGPGDPELLTVRASKVLALADSIVYDHLVSNQILCLVRSDAELIFVGKQENLHTLPQEEINTLLIRLAQQQKKVVRLKGGDPFIFGRGGEEAEALVEAGIQFEVVPGISSANGASAYAGIPLTHRDHAQSCVITTGHLKDGSLNLPWESLVQDRQTAVIYMGLSCLPKICEQLIAHGQTPDKLVAVIENATTINQRVITGNLITISDRVRDGNFHSPSLIIVGDVVALHEKLTWFKSSGYSDAPHSTEKLINPYPILVTVAA